VYTVFIVTHVRPIYESEQRPRRRVPACLRLRGPGCRVRASRVAACGPWRVAVCTALPVESGAECEMLSQACGTRRARSAEEDRALLLYCPLFSLIKYGRKNQNYKIRRRARVYKNTVFRAQPDRVSTLPEIFGSVATRVSSPRPVSSPRVPKTLHLSTTFAKTSGPPDLFCRLYLISTSGVCLSPRAPLAFPQKDYACKKTLLVVCACPLHRRPVGFSSKRTTLAKTYTAPP